VRTLERPVIIRALDQAVCLTASISGTYLLTPEEAFQLAFRLSLAAEQAQTASYQKTKPSFNHHQD
jgi:hypothetical protein